MKDKAEIEAGVVDTAVCVQPCFVIVMIAALLRNCQDRLGRNNNASIWYGKMLAYCWNTISCMESP
jgi:hypothetical protein